MEPKPFHFLGPSHIAVLALLALGVTAMCWAIRAGHTRGMRWVERALACVLLLEWPCNLLIAHWTGELDRNMALPAQLCDLAALCGGVALLTHQPEFCELVYFWGLAGTLQGLITPSLALDFPNLRFFGFFALHGGVVATALYLTVGRGITPRHGAVRRAMLWLLVYACVAGGIDALWGCNYGFLREKPFRGSIMDFLGPWPWYIGSLLLLAAALFWILDLPWWLKRRRG
jgi:hypothetical integral membrane protein (TIGR02206 family)